LGGAAGATRYKPHGVLAVFGPFNFPGHISNGHIVPALLAGNTVVFKPSDWTPLVAELTVAAWQESGLPAGVLNLVQGTRDTGIAVVEHAGLNGVLFTGSLKAGLSISRTLADRPETILALELGGNNPLIVDDVDDVDAAVYATLQSAYLTTGQRCTCARRLVVPPGNDSFLDRLAAAIPRLLVGPPESRPEPFMGPLIHSTAVDRVLTEQQRLVDDGATLMVEARRTALGDAFVTPGLIDVTDVADRGDDEVFGPLLQLIRVSDFPAAVAEANKTKYGLVAGLLSRDRDRFEQFYRQVNAGLVNWNRPTTGASGQLPFGGVGRSGNHRPAGYFTTDFCNIPVATLESETLSLPQQLLPGVSLP
jgi:succinylglutamic semialdehyde dehydrogenase